MLKSGSNLSTTTLKTHSNLLNYFEPIQIDQVTLNLSARHETVHEKLMSMKPLRPCKPLQQHQQQLLQGVWQPEALHDARCGIFRDQMRVVESFRLIVSEIWQTKSKSSSLLIGLAKRSQVRRM
eukprot:gnl/TRDRNA2_/TRDRNA2_130281_c1_seq1.p1 gnl/TRDRNA2_/TRDRNA2_130281_c1~~gnl/TRDRNA2_/TRDRNA2_130281_c1_seq1.p1  ORF type:complete len:124 (+),score=19.05 gnl/TRDRNA2_/TRDRNA2_130281_c1_seq1:24-395(+)